MVALVRSASRRSMLRFFPLWALVLALSVAQSSYALTITESTTFGQNLYVDGALSKGSGSFVIDHPLDPKNKLLYYSFVESPDMKNIYDGIAKLDERGEAEIELPAYFLALNKEFRYLATGLSGPMPDLHLAQGVTSPSFSRRIFFRIAGGVPGGKVSWQVSATRRDPFADEKRVVVEVDKAKTDLVEPGEYLFPDAYEKP